MAAYFADTAFWILYPAGGISIIPKLSPGTSSVVRTASRIVTTKAVLWEWLNALSDASTRTIAAEGYHRVQADRRIEVVPFQPELSDAAIGLLAPE